MRTGVSPGVIAATGETADIRLNFAAAVRNQESWPGHADVGICRSKNDFAGRSLRLQTLIRLRWLAVVGQSVAVAVVYLGLGFPLPICLVPRADRALGLAQYRPAHSLSRRATGSAP